jgi:hypothetical protein
VQVPFATMVSTLSDTGSTWTQAFPGLEDMLGELARYAWHVKATWTAELQARTK